MTKAELWKEVQKLLNEGKVNKELQSKFAKLLEPKKGGAKSEYIPPNDKDEHWCRKFELYLPKDNFTDGDIAKETKLKVNVASKRAKQLIKENRDKINKLKAELADLVNLVLDGKIKTEEAKKKRTELNAKIDELELWQKGKFNKDLLK